MANNRDFNHEQCQYCQCNNYLGCLRCENYKESRQQPFYKVKQQPLGKYLKDVAQGNFRTKKAWEMLPMGYKLLFLAIVMDWE